MLIIRPEHGRESVSKVHACIVIKFYGFYIELDELSFAKVWPQSRSSCVLSSSALYKEIHSSAVTEPLD